MKLCLIYHLAFSIKLNALAHATRSSYDYIIVGGGTSGLVVANRLSEDPDVTVLVIEVGPLDDGSPGTLVPGIQAVEAYRRVYNSTPQVQLYDRVSTLTTGQVVGGGTVINGMFFNRGSAEDYDAWAELGNGPGWGWEGLLPYFQKSENFTPPTRPIQQQFDISPDLTPHGTHGHVGSSFPPFAYGVVKFFYEACRSLGVEMNSQSNAGKAVGAFQSSLSLTTWNMSRSHASVAYYKGEPSRRPGLRLITGHRVRRVLFDGKRAVGVEYSSEENSTHILTAKATREVIIAAGAQRSPQILQLSGVGPQALLNQFNIPIIEDLPGVGYNFHDQPNYFMYLTNNYTLPTPNWLSYDIASHQSHADEQLSLYQQNRTGAYTRPYLGGGDVAFLPLQNITATHQTIISNAAAVDTQSTLPSGADRTILAGQRAQTKILLRHFASPNTATAEFIADSVNLAILANLKPLSRGSILITSRDPYSDPDIDFGTFMHPTDLKILIAAFRKTRQLISSPPFRSIGVQEATTAHLQSDEEIERELRNGTLASWQHPVGTLAMLPRGLGGVVDSRLCVYGIEGVRVVDASIMPVIPGSHTSSTVYAVAEKAADLIKEGGCC